MLKRIQFNTIPQLHGRLVCWAAIIDTVTRQQRVNARVARQYRHVEFLHKTFDPFDWILSAYFSTLFIYKQKMIESLVFSQPSTATSYDRDTLILKTTKQTTSNQAVYYHFRVCLVANNNDTSWLVRPSLVVVVAQ